MNECPGMESLPFDALFHGKIMKNACETAIRSRDHLGHSLQRAAEAAAPYCPRSTIARAGRQMARRRAPRRVARQMRAAKVASAVERELSARAAEAAVLDCDTARARRSRVLHAHFTLCAHLSSSLRTLYSIDARARSHINTSPSHDSARVEVRHCAIRGSSWLTVTRRQSPLRHRTPRHVSLSLSLLRLRIFTCILQIPELK